MNVFIAHAEADQAVADELKAFLRLRGLMAETETGERGFRYMQASDVVVALWSQAATFSPWRMGVERRMLEAWAEQRLVLVKLDHNFLPVGLRDLPAIDATFDRQRDLVNWPEVARQAREAINRAQAQLQAPPAPAAPSLSPQPAPSIGDRPSSDSFAGGGPASRAAPQAKKKGGGLFGMFAKKEAPAAPAGSSALNSNDKMMADRSEPAPAPAPPAASAAPALFISYSHADDAAVTPLVAIVEGHGRAVWIDKTGIHTGDGWAGEIVKAIKAAHGVLVMCSKHSFESDHVKREVYLADKYKKPMAPMFLEQAAPPEDFEYFFANVQWLELWKLPEADRAAAIGQALKAV